MILDPQAEDPQPPGRERAESCGWTLTGADIGVAVGDADGVRLGEGLGEGLGVTGGEADRVGDAPGSTW